LIKPDEPSGDNPSLDPSLMTGWTDLTDTERTVAELVARGMTNKQAGRVMFLSRHTVDYHLRRVFKKLGVNSRVELARAIGEHYEALNAC
jgi:DNA-binding CsgD family transcriptional regulator